MKKIFVIFIILTLVLVTAIIKNSTKRIDDEIFAKEENIRKLKKYFETLKLENDFLSSAEKLNEFQILYFENDLVKKNLQDINIIQKDKDNLRRFRLFVSAHGYLHQCRDFANQTSSPQMVLRE